jgi:16S rRNA (guanine527-N7)-methyltransferase
VSASEKIVSEMELLQRGLAQLNLPHDADVIEKFRVYLDFLQSENEKYNLTALRASDEIVQHHFLDSLLLLRAIRIHEQPLERLVDIGSGAGFPGVPLAILCSRTEFLLIESISKKCAFLRQLMNRLGLKNVSVLNERAETAAHAPDLREQFDIAVSRAVAKVPVLAELMLPFVKIGGRAILYKSPRGQEEAQQAVPDIALLGGDLKEFAVYQIPFSSQSTALLIVEKIKNTPAKYPRRPGIPHKRPLPR